MKSVAPLLRGRRKAVLDYLRSSGSTGGTREEIALALELRIQSTTPVVCELIELGVVFETEQTRPTTSGREAFVLVAR